MDKVTLPIHLDRLVASSDIELMIVDTDLVIHYCAQTVRAIFNLSKKEPLHSLSDALNKIIYAHIGVSLADKLLESIAANKSFDGEFQDSLGAWYLLRILPCKEKLNNKKLALISMANIDSLKATEKNLEKKAHFDSLTGLPNRASFMEALPRAVARAKQSKLIMAVFFIDLDNFKQINDNLGHNAGDYLLKTATQFMASQMPATGFIARLGGDEFGVILESAHSVNEITQLATAFIKLFSAPIKINNLEIKTSLSIGIACYPKAGVTAQALLKHADIAMYRAKELGKDAYQFFSNEINQQVKRKHVIESNLMHAIEREELSVVFQPQIDIENQHKTVGLEALARWNSPVLGRVKPEEFIAIAEESKLIFTIGEWLLENACQQYKALLQDQRIKHKPQLSVNVSAKQLTNTSFIHFVKKVIAAHQIPAELLMIEITESALLEQSKKTMQMIHELNDFGVKFALDDFGVGYSSLVYLKELPISALKIDQAFVADIASGQNNKHIIQAIVALADGLGVKVTAEGVETQEQLDYVKRYGCHIIQGFVFSKPLVINKLKNFICREL